MGNHPPTFSSNELEALHLSDLEASQDYMNPYNIKRIKHSLQQLASSNVICKTDQELGLDSN